MKKKITNLLILTLLIFILITILVYPTDIIKSVLFSFEIWKNNIFPTLFPFFIISDLLTNYGLINILGKLTKNIMKKLFYLPGEASFVIISSITSGFPSSAKFIKNLLDEEILNTNEAEYLLTFTHFSSPLFVIGFIGCTTLGEKELGYIILLSHIISNFIIAFITRKKELCVTNTKDKKLTITKRKGFIESLTLSITRTINTLLLLLGIITTFLIISTIILKFGNPSPLTKALISGTLEMTQGIKYISTIEIPQYVKASIIGFFISFGGISIHLQVMSILSDTKIKYRTYFLARIAHAFLTSSIILLITNLL